MRLLLALFLAQAPAFAGDIGRVPELSVPSQAAPVDTPNAPALRDLPSIPALPSPSIQPSLEAAVAVPAAAADHADLDTPAFLRRASPAAQAALKAAATPRQRLDAIKAALSENGRVDEKKTSAAFTGTREENAAAALTNFLPTATRLAVRDMILDGAPRHAVEQLDALKKSAPLWRKGEKKAALERLKAYVSAKRESPAVRELDRRLQGALALSLKREHAAALAGVEAVLEGVKASALRPGTVRAMWVEAAAFADRIKTAGAPVVYGGRGVMTSQQLAQRVAELTKRDPTAYVGAPVSAEPVRVQCWGDCAIQQAYSHPKLSQIGEQMPYWTFLNAVESRLGERSRAEGLDEFQSRAIVRELGLTMEGRGMPRSAEELVERLRRHGALYAGMRWVPSKHFGGWLMDDTDHAVVLQGAFRKEDGQWRFIVIDSNRSRPQLYSFEELRLLNSKVYYSLEALPPGDKFLPKDVRDMKDVAARTELLVNRFYGRYGAYREFVPVWKRWPAALFNVVLRALRLSEWEPAPVRRLDGNLLPLGRAPPGLAAALSKDRALKAKALVTAPDGRRFLNKLVLTRAGLL